MLISLTPHLTMAWIMRRTQLSRSLMTTAAGRCGVAWATQHQVTRSPSLRGRPSRGRAPTPRLVPWSCTPRTVQVHQNRSCQVSSTSVRWCYARTGSTNASPTQSAPCQQRCIVVGPPRRAACRGRRRLRARAKRNRWLLRLHSKTRRSPE